MDKSYKQANEKGLMFEFCKTARKPYDIMVCCVLLAAKHHLKARVSVSSDGDLDEWQPAIDLYEKVLGRKAPNLFRKRKQETE
jgi:hypothetical protein